MPLSQALMQRWLAHLSRRWKQGPHRDDWQHLLRPTNPALAAGTGIMLQTSSQTKVALRAEVRVLGVEGVGPGDELVALAHQSRQMARPTACHHQSQPRQLTGQLTRRCRTQHASARAWAQSLRTLARALGAPSAPTLHWVAPDAAGSSV